MAQILFVALSVGPRDEKLQYLRFRLKTLFLIFTVLTFTIGYWAVRNNQRIFQLKLIRNFNGNAITSAFCDYNGVPGPPTSESRFRSTFGGNLVFEPLRNIVYVDLSDSIFGDEEVDMLHNFRHVKHLDLSNTNVSDNAINELLVLRDLSFIDLSNSRVTSQGIVRLRLLNPALKIRYDNRFRDMLDLIDNFEKEWRRMESEH